MSAKARRPKKAVDKPSQKFMGLLIDYNESGGTDNAMLTYVRQLEADVESWKKRAAQHGCNVESGDDDCG